LILNLSSSNSAAADVPPTVAIPPNAHEGVFQIRTHKLTVSATVTIAATAYAQLRAPDGRWVAVGTPKKSSATLTVVGESASTGFDPRIHGFHFINSFTGRILIDIPLIGTRDLGPTSYGLCGGMSYAALDNFIYGGQIPSDRSPPVSDTPLRSYIY